VHRPWDLILIAIFLRILCDFHQPATAEGAGRRGDRGRSGVKETCGRQSTFGEIGGFRQREHGVVRSKLVGDGGELDIASSWEMLEPWLRSNHHVRT
jgi:hypothetical protein